MPSFTTKLMGCRPKWHEDPVRQSLPALTICALYKSRWQVELFFKWIKQHLRIAILRNLGECGEDPDLDRGVGVRAGRHCPEETRPGGVALHIAAGHFGHSLWKDADPVCILGGRRPDCQRNTL
jgi:hypothetical protein